MTMMISADDDKAPAELFVQSKGAWFVVAAFMLIYLVSYIDRQALTIIVEPIKLSLGVSDTQIGLLQGFLFTTVMIVAAVPMAYLIDRYNRITIMFCCMIAWSLATIATGFANSFGQLAAGRIGLAIAEAIVPMCAVSVISDLFARNKVGSATGVFMNGSYFGNGIAFLLGGWLLSEFQPYRGQVVPLLGPFEEWRGLLIAVGLLGIVVAIGIRLTLPEPKRRELTVLTGTSESLARFMSANWRFIAPYCAFASCIAMLGYCLYAWPATLLIRVHGMSATNVGLMMGPMFLLTSIPATVLASWLGARCKPEQALQHLIKVMMGLIALMCPSVIAMSLAPTSIALTLVGVTLFLYAAGHCAILVPVSLVAPNRLRGRVSALTSMIYVIPAGMGPVLVGYLTDHFFKDPMKLGSSMAIVMGGATGFAVIFGALALRSAKRLESAAAAMVLAGAGQTA